MTNETIPNVPRELLERASNLAFQTQHYPLHEELRTLLSAPSPAGVDGWDVAGDILEKLSAAQAIIDGLRGENERIRLNIAEYNEAIACYQSERNQQAQRIGELEGLLLRVQVSLSLDDTEWGYSGAEKYKLLADIRAALSAGKEGE